MSPSPDHTANQILGPVPGWIRRWMIWLPALIVLFFLVVAWLIRYPDEVEAPCRLVGQQPLRPLVAPSSGVLSDFWVADGSIVPEGAWVASLDLPKLSQEHFSNMDQFMQVGQQRSNPGSICGAMELLENYPPFLKSAWINLEAACLHWKDVRAEAERLNQRANLLQQQEEVRAALRSLAIQDSIMVMELAVAEEQYNRFQQMFEARAVSRLELEQAEQNYLERQRLQQVLDEEKYRYTLQQAQLEAELLQLEQRIRAARRDAQSRILTNWGTLEEAWEHLLARKLLRAPVSGRFQSSGLLRAGTYVEAGTELGAIETEVGEDSVTAIILIPQLERGTIAEGDAVQITMAGFPEGEYGILEAKINSLSNIPVEGFFSTRVMLALPLKTNYGKEIPFRQDMQGQARIITSQKRLLNRLFYRLREVAQ